ncbi:MAG: hypothetical protein AMJ46_14530 [Latescibacteria bacterium DG_63]|nr:MAG: hypothetical protein AMJ46_14530 [Latescibacteria bacterium DG_63]
MYIVRFSCSVGTRMVVVAALTCVTYCSVRASPDTTEVYEYVLSWGEHGSGPGQFNGASRMGSDRHGNVYVCDGLNYRVQKFDSLGSFLMMFGEYGQGPGQFDVPNDVAVNDSGYIYVVDYHNCRVQKFNSLGQFVLEFGEYGHEPGQLAWPQNVGVGDSGYVYVVDAGNHRVQRFTNGGDFDTLWGPPDSMTSHELVVATYPGSVYAVWSKTGPTEKYIYRSDPVGNTILSFGGFGSGPGEFVFLIDMATDSEGSLFVGDDWLTRVTKFDSLGNFITMWGEAGSGPGQFGYLVGVATDLYGNVYVSDYDYDRIHKFQRVFVEVSGEPDVELASELTLWLGPNVPNPFSASTVISYAVPEVEELRGLSVRLVIYNSVGQAIVTLINGPQPPGVHNVSWNGRSSNGDPVASGVYLYRLECGGEVMTRRCVLVR